MEEPGAAGGMMAGMDLGGNDHGVRHFNESEVRAALTPARVIAAVERGFGTEFGEFVLPARTQVTLGGRGVLLLMPCYHAGRNLFGLKVATVGELF